MYTDRKPPQLGRWSPGLKLSRRLTAYGFLAPAAILVCLIIAYPLVVAATISFHDIRIFQSLSNLADSANLENYRRLFANDAFWRALRTSLIYVVVTNAVALFIGLSTALLLNQRFPGRNVARMLVMLPWPVPGVVAALAFTWMFNTSFGVINYLLLELNLVNAPVAWFTSTIPAFIAVIAATAWQGYPFFTIMLLAALQAIPGELYEAASVDGANSRQSFWRITLPALRPVIGISVLISSLWVLRNFDIIYVMTGGGPSRRTETLAVQIYVESFEYLKMGYASSIGMVTLVIALALAFVYLRYIGKDFY